MWKELWSRLLEEDERPGAVAWSRSYLTTMQRFLSLYSLHDSYWLDLRLDPARARGALLEFEFCPDEIEGPPWSGAWPILLMRIPEVRSLTFEKGQECYPPSRGWETIEIEDATTRLSRDGSAETVISGFQRERVTLTHGPEIGVLCVSDRGDVVTLARLEQ